MGKKIEQGKYYAFRRITGKVIKGEFTKWQDRNSPLTIQEFYAGGSLNLDCLTDQEYDSLKEIDRYGQEVL